MATTSRQQPPWQKPKEPGPEADIPPLKIWNSLTRTKNLFIPLDWKSKKVTWYACGPTVYDDAHLGHARNYVTTDIIRRILRDYFKYNVEFVMNITDVDDKIIVRGRQQYLLDEYKARPPLPTQDLTFGSAALEAYLEKNLPKVHLDLSHGSKGLLESIPSGSSLPGLVEEQVTSEYDDVLQGGSLDAAPPGDREAKLKMHIKTVLLASQAIEQLRNDSISRDEFFAGAQDILLPYLDSLKGSTIDGKDHSIFTRLTKRFEDRFMDDVRSLNCLDPDKITRVTEYGPQIVQYVEKIQQNGFAYTTSDGSVYFDIAAFEAAHNTYARLEPWSRGDKTLQADGEGALTKKTSEKKSDSDFALWKSSKPGEPSWPSSWGNGRPGWHIECSAMASDVLGQKLDIHSGGIDLAFPHHDNELAQSEAYWLDQSHEHQHQWVNYFMHMGHLSIQGSKMSKSLKNFTTIKEALSRGDWTPRSLRIVFLLGGWKDGIEITDELVKAGSAWEDKLNNFFINTIDVLDRNRQVHEKSSPIIVSLFAHEDLVNSLAKAKKETFEALCDSFHTPTVMGIMSEMISKYNALDKDKISPKVTEQIARWVTSMVNMLGLNGTAGPDATVVGWSGVTIPAVAKTYVYPLSALRDTLRGKARGPDGVSQADIAAMDAQNPSAPTNGQTEEAELYIRIGQNFQRDIRATENSSSRTKDILLLCDRLRDVDLFDVGIFLQDRDADDGPALVRPVTRELRAAREERDHMLRQKQKAREDREREALSKAGKGRLSHLKMFRTSEYSAWDDDGLPLKDDKGEEIKKSRAKKLRKDWERQKKSHEAWLKLNS